MKNFLSLIISGFIYLFLGIALFIGYVFMEFIWITAEIFIMFILAMIYPRCFIGDILLYRSTHPFIFLIIMVAINTPLAIISVYEWSRPESAHSSGSSGPSGSYKDKGFIESFDHEMNIYRDKEKLEELRKINSKLK